MTTFWEFRLGGIYLLLPIHPQTCCCEHLGNTWVRALNLTVTLGTCQTILGTGRVRASILSPCRPLAQSTAQSADITNQNLFSLAVLAEYLSTQSLLHIPNKEYNLNYQFVQQLKTPIFFRSTKQNRHFYKCKNSYFRNIRIRVLTFNMFLAFGTKFSIFYTDQDQAYSSPDTPLNHRVKNCISYEAIVANRSSLCIWGEWNMQIG